MTSITSISPTLLGPAKAPQAVTDQLAAAKGAAGSDRVAQAKELKQAYTQFVGETFFGQMLKAMRQSVGEPAYFHGGSAERQFQAQLDQHLAQDMGGAGAGGLADDLFASQFPEEAALLAEQVTLAEPVTPAAPTDSPLAQLDHLRRR